MSEEARAQLAHKAKLRRLQVRGSNSEAPISGVGTTGQFLMTYRGTGVFYPEAVYVFGMDYATGDVTHAVPQQFDLSIHNMYGDQVLGTAATQQCGNLNSYYDNFDHGLGLAPQEYYLMRYTLQTAALVSLWAVFVGEEYLF